MALEPGLHLFEITFSLEFVDILSVTRGRSMQVDGCCVVVQATIKLGVGVLQDKQHFIATDKLFFQLGRVIGLNKVHVIVERRFGCLALIRRAEEHPAGAVDVTIQPFELVPPHLNIRLLGISFLQDLQHGFTISTITAVIGQQGHLVFDIGIKIFGLFQIQKELIVGLVLGEELAVDGFTDLGQYRDDLGFQVFALFPWQLFDAG